MSKHTAFVSYSYAADEERVPGLQRALQRVATPWYRVRARNVLLDRGNLRRRRRSVEELQVALQQLIARADTFLLLASRAAASSTWVSYEVEQWLKHGDLSKFVIVLTDGQIRWDQNSGDFDWQETTALPECLKGKFPLQPQYIDLSTARLGRRLLDDPLSLSAIVTLASVLDTQEKERFISAWIRNTKRAQRLMLLCLVVIGLYGVLGAALQLYVWTARTHPQHVWVFMTSGVFLIGMSVLGVAFMVRASKIKTKMFESLRTETSRRSNS